MPSSRLPLLAAPLALALAACAAREAPPPAPPPRPVAVAPARPATLPGHLTRARVDQILVTQGPPWVLRRVMSEEVMNASGKFEGWRIVGLPEEWRDIDLRPGDVVQRVNGLPLETPDQAWDAWKSVATATAVTVTLRRDGATRTLVLPIDGAASPDTLKALGRDPGPRRVAAPEPRGHVLGNGSTEIANDEAY